MAHKRKKAVKYRGSKTHGHGSKKKRRGKGSRGGKGYGGMLKHRKFYIFKYDPDHFGKTGFKSLQQKGFRERPQAVNLRDLMAINGDEIDTIKMGFGKVLGTGEVGRPVTIIARSFSASAKEKIEKAGGKAVEK